MAFLLLHNTCWSPNGRPHILEDRKNTFAIIKEIHPGTKKILDHILADENVELRMMKGKYGSGEQFSLEYEKRDSVISRITGVGFSFHTLEDHVHILNRTYRKRDENLGLPIFIALPKNGEWKTYNPTRRKWDKLTTFPSGNNIAANVKVNSILRYSPPDTYYRIKGTTKNSLVAHITKTAAYNLMQDQHQEVKAYWVEDDEEKLAIIKISAAIIRSMPSKIMWTMLSFNSDPVRRATGALFFDQLYPRDFELISQMFSWCKINLVKVSSIKDIDGARKKTVVNTLMRADLEAERLECLEKILKDHYAKMKETDDGLVVFGRKRTITIHFSDIELSMEDGTNWYVSIGVLSDPERMIKLGRHLRKMAGLGKMGDMDKIVAKNWPSITDADNDFRNSQDYE
jgi:hypothetical protein